MFFFFHSFLVNCNHTGCTEESCSTATHECKINCLVKCSGSSDQVCVFVLSLGSGLFALDKTKYKHKSMDKYKGLVFVHAFVFVFSLFPACSLFFLCIAPLYLPFSLRSLPFCLSSSFTSAKSLYIKYKT